MEAYLNENNYKFIMANDVPFTDWNVVDIDIQIYCTYVYIMFTFENKLMLTDGCFLIELILHGLECEMNWKIFWRCGQLLNVYIHVKPQ